MLSIIAAVAENNAIGYQNKLIYWLPDDLKRFKALTSGHTIIMGRNTFESLPKGALPNRRNIVLSRQENASFPGADHYKCLKDALDTCKEDEETFIIGGASLYNEAITCADRLYLTHVADTPANADAYFPAIDNNLWTICKSETHGRDEKHQYKFCFKDYIRKSENT